MQASRRQLLKGAAGAAVAAATSAGWSQADFPNKPVKIIAGYPPGQGIDIIGRAVAAKLQPLLGQQFYLDNRPGAQGMLAQQLAAAAPADGYTLLITAGAAMAINPSLYQKLPYDPVKDYAPVAGLTSVPLVLVANPAFPANSLPELIAMARAKPGKINFGSFGSGSTNHLVMELLASTAQVKMTHVPYKGSAAAITDIVGGRVEVMFDTPPSSLPLVKDKRLKPLVVTSRKRLALFPDVPTLAEAGFPNVSGQTWMAIVAPAGTPAPVVHKLSTAITTVVQSPEMRDFIAAQGVEPMPLGPEELGAFIKAEIARWAVVVKASGAKAD